MLSAFQGYGLILATSAIIIVADAVLKSAADAGHAVYHGQVVLGAGLYLVSALVWFWAMHHVGLTQGGVAFAMLSLLALAAIDVFWFGMRFGPREVAGILAAIAAMILMTRPA